jgi:Zn finger protein HypA/HybF involved in hydrogenase expression
MGFRAFARCEVCGYSNSLQMGAGRATYLIRADWPVWCGECGNMDTTNYMERPLRCEHCHSTNVTRPEARINTRMKRKPVLTWTCRLSAAETKPPKKKFFGFLRRSDPATSKSEELGLHDGYYRCPACNEHRLRFSAYMHFD